MTSRLRLSKSAIAELKPAKSRQDYYDTSVAGLAVTVTPKGAKAFYMVRWHQGKTLRHRLGSCESMTPEQARLEAQKVLGQLAEGIDPQAERRAIRAETTLGELFTDHYLPKHARPKKRTANEDERRWKLHASCFNARRLSDLTVPEVSAWHARIGRDHGPIAANRVHALLRKVYGFARLEGYTGSNPAEKIPHFPETKRDRFVSHEEMPRLFRAIAALDDPDPRDLFMLLLLTAARRANVLAMRWEDIDLKRNVWTIPSSQFKTGKTVSLPIIAPAAVILNRRHIEASGPWVFKSHGKSGHFVEPKTAWRRVLKLAEVYHLVELIATAKSEPVPAMAGDVRAELVNLRDAGMRTRTQTDPIGTVLGRLYSEARALKLDVSKIGLVDLHLHDLRRTGASFMAMAGVPLHTIAVSLGHDGTNTTPIYARLSVDAQRAAMTQAVEAMQQAAGIEVAS